jgi:preprotein translocase subunit SecD
MRRTAMLVIVIVIGLFGLLLQGQAQVAIRAASSEPVAGWQEMRISEGERPIWVAPSDALVAGDIERAESYKTADGRTAVGMVFTDTGAQRMRELSRSQLNKLVALLVDGKLIWAPLVRSEIGKQTAITGNGPNGVPQAVVDRILSTISRDR